MSGSDECIGGCMSGSRWMSERAREVLTERMCSHRAQHGAESGVASEGVQSRRQRADGRDQSFHGGTDASPGLHSDEGCGILMRFLLISDALGSRTCSPTASAKGSSDSVREAASKRQPTHLSDRRISMSHCTVMSISCRLMSWGRNGKPEYGGWS